MKKIILLVVLLLASSASYSGPTKEFTLDSFNTFRAALSGAAQSSEGAAGEMAQGLVDDGKGMDEIAEALGKNIDSKDAGRDLVEFLAGDDAKSVFDKAQLSAADLENFRQYVGKAAQFGKKLQPDADPKDNAKLLAKAFAKQAQAGADTSDTQEVSKKANKAVKNLLKAVRKLTNEGGSMTSAAGDKGIMVNVITVVNGTPKAARSAAKGDSSSGKGEAQDASKKKDKKSKDKKEKAAQSDDGAAVDSANDDSAAQAADESDDASADIKLTAHEKQIVNLMKALKKGINMVPGDNKDVAGAKSAIDTLQPALKDSLKLLNETHQRLKSIEHEPPRNLSDLMALVKQASPLVDDYKDFAKDHKEMFSYLEKLTGANKFFSKENLGKWLAWKPVQHGMRMAFLAVGAPVYHHLVGVYNDFIQEAHWLQAVDAIIAVGVVVGLYFLTQFVMDLHNRTRLLHQKLGKAA